MRNKFLSSSLLITMLSSGLHTYAQNSAIQKEVIKSTLEYATNNYDLLVPRESDPFYDGKFKQAHFVKLNTQALVNLVNNDQEVIAFNIPTLEGEKQVLLKRQNIYAPDFQALERKSDGTLVPTTYEKGDFYRGYLPSTANSFAAISFYKNEIGGVFTIAGEGNYNIVLDKNNPGANNENYIIFREKDIISDQERPTCATDDNYNLNNAEGINVTEALSVQSSCKAVTVALYADYLAFVKNSNNVQNTNNYLTTVFNGNAALFQNERINILISRLIVHSAPDNYPTNTSNAVLSRFGNDIQTNTTGDLMQMITASTQNGWSSLGGLAWLDQLCQTPFAYNGSYVGPFSMVNTAGVNNLPLVPIYSWDIEASNHEMGHNLGSPHTQSCSWNGNNTAIDGCVNAEGNCANGPVPGLGQGTIMSYCHLNNNVGIDFVNGYGPQPGDLIRSYYSRATCLTQSVKPNNIPTAASTTTIADKVCEEGGWLYIYTSKNDNDLANDELVLMVQKTPSIAAMDLSQISAKIITNAQLGTGVPKTIGNTNYSFFTDQKSLNKHFEIILPATPSGEFKVRFPFTENEFSDLKNATNVTTPEPFWGMLYTTSAVMSNPSAADTNSIKTIRHTLNTATPNSWSMNYTNPDYYIAEFRMNQNYLGGTLVYGNNPKYNLSTKNILEQNAVAVYPNPATQFLNINNPQQKTIKVEIFDNLGRIVKATTIDKTSTISIELLNSGMYTLRISIDNETHSQKLSIIK